MTANKPRIAILTPFLHHASGYGGITPWLVNLANGFDSSGADVDILVNAKQETPLHYPPIAPSVRILNHGYHKYEAFQSLLKYLRQTKPDVLLSAGHRYNAMSAWAKVITKTPTKVFLSVHENISAGSKNMKSWKRYIRYLSIRHLYARTDGIISVSQGVADDLHSLGLPTHCSQVIYNPIVNAELIEKSKQAVQHPWLQQSDEPVIIGVGRLEHQKDYPTLIKALAKIRQSQPCKLIILGEGRQRNTLQNLIDELGLQEHVDLKGHVDNPFAYMARSQVFVLSSAWEGFGNVIAEALAVGTPVVSTDCPSGPREILMDGKYGPLTPVHDSESLAQAINQTLNTPNNHEILRQRGNDFSVDSAVDHYWQYMLGDSVKATQP